MDTERKLRAAPRPGPLRPETYPSLVSDPRASDGGKKGGRKEERNGTAGSVSEPYISAGTNCPIIHSVRQLRCSPLIHRCYFPPSSPFLLLPFLLSPLSFSSLLSSFSLFPPRQWYAPAVVHLASASPLSFLATDALLFFSFQFVHIPDRIILLWIEISDGLNWRREREREISNFHN